jgi:phenylalanyl-tRNA synthetase alpha chain
MELKDIQELQEKAVAEADAAGSPAEIEEVRVRYLGRKGLLPEIMKGLKTFAPEERPLAGQAANALKQALQAALDTKSTALESSGPETAGLDLTLPGDAQPVGTLHPVTLMMRRIVRIFDRIGFTVASGPDIESTFNNFDALNTPENHPSRAPSDTFYLDDGRVLRTHTSPVQVRYMQSHPPPIRIVAPGRCYRRDTTDATHSANFHQVEGLYVAESVSMADLKSDLYYFAREMMGPNANIRFRPHFFPFTEPSVEVDFSCHVCEGKGCRVCKNSGWIEIMGAGMVDPEVLKAVGYDPDAVSGYAFGMGVERLAMILYGIDDIRLLYENDARFLEQFV